MVRAGLATPVRRQSALGPVVPGLASPGLVLGLGGPGCDPDAPAAACPFRGDRR